MPNRETHTLVGAAAGVAAAIYRAREQTPDIQRVEAIGGVIGGYLGGRVPDLLDPPTSPTHRDLAHSLAAVALTLSANLAQARTACRARAAECRETSGVPRAAGGSLALPELLWYLLAGALTGLQAGYVSHLLLDAGTPVGLPLLFAADGRGK